MNIEQNKKYRFEFVDKKGFTERAIYTIREINPNGIYFEGYNMLHLWSNIKSISEV